MEAIETTNIDSGLDDEHTLIMDQVLSQKSEQPVMLKAFHQFGLAGKLFIGFMLAVLVPLTITLLATAIIHVMHSKLIVREVLSEKTHTASLLFNEQSQQLAAFLRIHAGDSSIFFLLEEDLGQTLEDYLSELAVVYDLDWIWIRDLQGQPRFSTDELPVPSQSPGIISGGLNPLIRLETADPVSLVGEIRLWPRHSANGTTPPGFSLAASIRLDLIFKQCVDDFGSPMFLFDLDGNLLTFSTPETLEADMIVFPVGWNSEKTDKEIYSVGIAGKKHFLSLTAYLISGRPAAWIGIGYSVATLLTARNHSLIAIGLAFLSTLILSALAASLFFCYIVLPVRQLAAAARHITKGNYGTLTGISLPDEIGELAREFDCLSLALAQNETERQITEAALRQSEAQFRAIFDGVSEAIFVHDIDTGKILDANQTAAELNNTSVKAMLGQSPAVWSAAEEGFTESRVMDIINRARGGELVQTEWLVRKEGGATFWVELVARRTQIGKHDRILVSCRSIEERKRAEKAIACSLTEKETLLKEIHHRVKNNFQIIRSLLDLQATTSNNPALANMLIGPRLRIQTMALVHEQLYQTLNFSSIDLGEYVRELIEEIRSAYSIESYSLNIEVTAESIEIDIDRAIPCGLILNELVTNALKYAFPVGFKQPSTISIILKHLNGQVILQVADNGIGLPNGVMDGKRETLGLTLVEALTQQLKGCLSLKNTNGTVAEISFEL